MVISTYKHARQALLLIAAAAILPAAFAAAEVAGDQATLGKEALQKGAYDQAREQFDSGLRSARENEDVDGEVRFLFYRALTEQSDGETSGDPETLERAAGYYRRALALKPDSGSTMVNLAQVFHRLGRIEAADELYRRAIALEDERRSAYMENYADFLRETDRSDQALAVYRRLVALDPQNFEAQQALADYFLDPGRDWGELEGYLWELLRAGEIDRGLDGALEALGDRTGARQRESLLTMIAAGLSRQFVAPADFLEASWADQLWGFSEDPEIGDGVRQLFAVYGTLVEDGDDRWQEGNPYAEMDFSWWQRGDRWQDPEIGMYPRDAFRRLMRSLGDRYSQREKFWVAEDCYETAATFTRDELDAAAIRDLVNLYGRNGKIDKIEELASKFEFNLFEAKGEAYRASHLEKIYQYHQTLGQIYGYLAEKTGDWGNSGKPNSAIFQLERAYSVGQRLDQMDREREAHEYHVDPGLVQRLARAYEATGEQDRAADLRLRSAERYESAGDERAKTYVLRPVEGAALAPAQQLRYEKLTAPKLEEESQPQLERKIDPKVETSIERRNRVDG